MAAELEFYPLGLAEFTRRVRTSPGTLDAFLEQAGDRSAARVAAAARARAPRKTGRLARSIRARRVAKSAWSVGSDLIYARIHEFGGTIVPKKSRFLVFQVGGRWVRAKSVHIPARPYIRPALAESGRFIRDEFKQAGQRVTAHLARE